MRRRDGLEVRRTSKITVAERLRSQRAFADASFGSEFGKSSRPCICLMKAPLPKCWFRVATRCSISRAIGDRN